MAFPEDPQDLHVEFWVDGAYADVIDDVRYDGRMVIKRGRPNERSRVGPSAVSFTLDNTDGRYTNLNPASPYYRKLPLNTLMQIRIGSDERFVGEVVEWKQRRDPTNNDQYMQVVATGVLRKLHQGSKAFKSALYRSLTRTPIVSCYWPLEDGSDATQAASAHSGGQPLQFTAAGGTLGFASATDQPVGSAPVLDLSTGGGTLHGPANPVSTDPDALRLQFIGKFETGTGASTARLFMFWHTTGGTYTEWAVGVDASNRLLARGWGAGGTLGVDLNSTATIYDSAWHRFEIGQRYDDGTGDLIAYLSIDDVEHDTGPTSGGVGETFGVINDMMINRDRYTGTWLPSIGHLTVVHGDVDTGFSDPMVDNDGLAVLGYDGEVAGRRIERLMDEEGIAIEIVGDQDQTDRVGPQATDTLVENCEQAAFVDQGILYERRAGGMSYRTRLSTYNQAPAAILDYSSGHLDVDVEPDTDEQRVWNDVTVTRPSGSFARKMLLAEDVDDPYHTLAVDQPPDGVGPYDQGSPEANTYIDGQLQHLASWLLHQGTWNEARIPQIGVDLARAPFIADADLATSIEQIDIGDVIAITDPPSDLAPDTLLLTVQGYTEIIGRYERKFRWNTTPAKVREVWQLDTGGSTLVVARDSDDTSFKIATSAGPPLITGNPLLIPYHLRIAGETVEVTSMVEDSPAFIAAGTVAHGNNASVSPGIPAGMTANVGQALLGWAAIRNSGTGTVDLPSGYTELARVGNVLFFGAYYTGQSAPTITFTGGAANADTSARLWGMSGVSLALDDGDYRTSAASPQTLLNASAANIAYPALSVRRHGGVAFVLAWKADDWTSVATPAAMDAEIFEDDTTTGDDQGIAVYYDIQTVATDIAAGSLVVTGGASAISRAVVVALRPLQTATVVRGINGASVSPAAGEAVHVQTVMLAL
jgi:hypothetical protein